MAALYLIRHGQASFGEPEYDELSSKGRQQSVMLGQSWHNLPQPDKFYTGDLKRHKQTFDAFNTELGSSSDVFFLSELNEFDHIDILLTANPKWQTTQDIFKAFAHREDAKAALTDVFNQALSEWITDVYSPVYQENWHSFKTRCVSGLHKMVSQRTANEQHIFAFSSGGVIAATIQYLLSLSDEHTLQLMQQLRNTSVTKVLFSGDRISLDYYNNYRHLENVGASWSTYR